MERKNFIYTDNFGDDNQVSVVFDMYRDNDNLFIGLEEYDEEFDYWDSYCDVTVNVGNLPFLESAININLGGQEKIDFLVKNGFGELTDKILLSGFCKYPVFKFNEDKLKELDPEFFTKYAVAHGKEIYLPLDSQISGAEKKFENVDISSNIKNKSIENEIE